MDKSKFNRYLKERYDDQVNWYRTKAAHNQKWAKRTQIIIIVFSIATVVFAAAGQQVLTVFFSASGAAVLALSKYYKFDELWNNYRTVRETLKKEKYAYDYSVGPYETAADKEKLFIERVEQVISKENTEWVITTKEKIKQGR